MDQFHQVCSYAIIAMFTFALIPSIYLSALNKTTSTTLHENNAWEQVSEIAKSF